MNKVLLLYSICVLISLGCNKNLEMQDRPNFVVIYTDDQQYNGLGLYNQAIKTPNIDKMASSGIQFLNAYVAFSLCSPSRAAMLTGRYGSQNGVLGLGSHLSDTERLMSQYLKEAGYITGISGKWHIGQRPENLSFDFVSYFEGNGTYYGRKVFDQGDTLFPENHVDEYGVMRSMEFLETYSDADAPFFLLHCPQTPHMNHKLEWDAKDSTKQTYQLTEMPVPQNRLDSLQDKPPYLKTVRNRTQALTYGYPNSLAIQSHTRDYYAVITELDAFLGELFHKIEELGLMENTYIIFMSDNGWMLGDHGFTSKVLPYRPSSHVPFWISGPGVAAQKHQAIVSNLDILPTILDLAGIELPTNLHGKSLLPLIEEEQSTVRDYFIYEGLGSYGGSAYHLGLLTGRYNYIKTFQNRELNEVTFRELYDWQNDSLEINNLIINPAYTEQVEEFDQKITKYMTEILRHNR